MGDTNFVYVTQYYCPAPVTVNINGNVVIDGRVMDATTTADDGKPSSNGVPNASAPPPASDLSNIRLDHLTKQFQQMCVAGSSGFAAWPPPPSSVVVEPTPVVPTPENAVIPNSLSRFRQACADAVFTLIDEGDVFPGPFRTPYGTLDTEHCFHLTQPGRSGFKMFLRMSRGLQTRLRSLSEMDGRPSPRLGSFRQRGPYARHGRPSPYFAAPPAAPPPSPSSSPPSFFGRHRISVSASGRRPSVSGRFDLLHCSIPEEPSSSSCLDVDDVVVDPVITSGFESCVRIGSSPPTSPSRPSPLTTTTATSRRPAAVVVGRRGKYPLTIEEILARGSRLPSVLSEGDEPQSPSDASRHQQLQPTAGVDVDLQKVARDIDRVVRGLKYLAVE